MTKTKEHQSITIPEDASIFYVTPTYMAYHNKDQTHVYRDKDEAKVRRFAAGGSGNGSGYIYRLVLFTHYVKDGPLMGYGSYKLEEELEPVTEFDPQGLKRRERYLELVNCKHEKTRTTMYGAGCQKDYETTCVKCGKYIA